MFGFPAQTVIFIIVIFAIGYGLSIFHAITFDDSEDDWWTRG